jgi:hypothetical protein
METGNFGHGGKDHHTLKTSTILHLRLMVLNLYTNILNRSVIPLLYFSGNICLKGCGNGREGSSVNVAPVASYLPLNPET